MGLLGDITAYIDNLKRRGSNTLADLATNPLGLLSRNLSAFSESLPAAPDSVMPSGGGLLNRPGFQQWGMDVALNAPTMGLLGHTVYHGSPHKFDKFDASKIGTGEGAQAFGHGLYLAEAKQTAGTYKSDLAGRVPINDLRKLQSHDSGESAISAAKMMFDQGYSEEKIAEVLQQAYPKLQPELQQVAISVARPGSLYTVDLPDEWLPKMLDWDKPLSQQPEEVRQAMSPEAMGLSPHKYGPNYGYAPSPVGPFIGPLAKSPQEAEAAWYSQNAGKFYEDLGAERQAERLRQAGIPGIRYLDGGSRKSGEGTYNYVVFPGMEELLKIISRE